MVLYSSQHRQLTQTPSTLAQSQTTTHNFDDLDLRISSLVFCVSTFRTFIAYVLVSVLVLFLYLFLLATQILHELHLKCQFQRLDESALFCIAVRVIDRSLQLGVILAQV